MNFAIMDLLGRTQADDWKSWRILPADVTLIETMVIFERVDVFLSAEKNHGPKRIGGGRVPSVRSDFPFRLMVGSFRMPH
jgi:hypothetical protein